MIVPRETERLLSPDGRRHFRRRYRVTEVWWGLAVLGGLLAVAGWVRYRGSHPDPTLHADVVLLRVAGQGVTGDGRPVAANPASHDSQEPQDRGPVPAGLAAAGWREGPVAVFDANNLYEKINGREGFYKAFGFQRLYVASLRGANDETVDLELFDLGSATNALGAYAGERPQGVASQVEGGGLGHLRRNALMMARGRFYARAIGSDESPSVRAQLEHLHGVLVRRLRAEPLPWGYAFFVGQLGVDPSRVTYLPRQAFSFGFADAVYTATQEEGDQELFVSVRSDDGAAQALAEKLTDGFMQMGRLAGRSGSITLVRDEYLDTLSAARSEGRWVVGVRRAPDRARAVAAIERLVRAVRALPDDLIARAASETQAAQAAAGQGATP